MQFLYLLFSLLLLLLHVDPGQAQSCKDLSGYCQIPLNKKCPYGSLPANCGINARCCARKPPTTDACAKLGGFCQVPLNEECPSGVSYPANCGINARCCKPAS